MTDSAARLRARRDWAARTRANAIDSLRYSRFVLLMKRVLPITAAVVIAAVLIYSLVPRRSDRITMVYQRMGRIENDLAMVQPRLSGTDAKGNPFVITADRAIQDAHNPRRARLVNIQADMTLNGQQWVNASAAKGAFDMDAHTLVLTGGISIFSDSGYELHTSRGNVDLKIGRFVGPANVTGQGPSGTFSADRFEIDHATQMIYLIGDVHMTMLLPHSKA
ncbi:MAG: LPS export ABC transporter periplasmic protein LptC [Alphaproteobacteria bacterium]|nr:LPS export ABC transporter periplasmic protein LptC [Alphaproteobacteria bacterium]